MSRLILFSLVLLVGLFLVQSGEQAEVTYYVKPSQSSSPVSCPTGQLCETLQYYLNDVDSMINQQEDVTMIFLEGNHTRWLYTQPLSVQITTPVIMQNDWRGPNVYVQVSLIFNFAQWVIPNQFNQSFHMTISESDEAGFV